MQIEPPMGMAIVQEDDPNLKDLDPLLTKKADNEEVEISNEVELGEITKDEEIESSSAVCCHICLEYDSEPGDELISPCMCKGTQQFVHRSCLDHWRSVKEGFAFSHCTTCKAQFHLGVEFPEDYPWCKIKFRLFVAGDVLLVFLFVQTIIACLGGLVYFLDRDGDFRNCFSDSWDRVLSKHPVARPLPLLHTLFYLSASGRMSGGSHASGDEGEQKQNKLLSLDLSAEGMNANQVSYEVLKLRSKGKHEEADGLAISGVP